MAKIHCLILQFQQKKKNCQKPKIPEILSPKKNFQNFAAAYSFIIFNVEIVFFSFEIVIIIVDHHLPFDQFENFHCKKKEISIIFK